MKLIPFVSILFLPCCLFTFWGTSLTAEDRVRYEFDTLDGWRDASQNDAGPINYTIIPEPEANTNNLLRIETNAYTAERAKVATINNTFTSGRYYWRVFVPALGENDQASIGAFVWRDDQHEIDFEIFHGKQADRDLLNAQEDDIILLLTVQNSVYQERVLIKREQWLTLELNLEVRRPNLDSVYDAQWFVNNEWVGAFSLAYGPEVEFTVFCSLENLTFTGDHPPKQNNYVLFDYFEFIPQLPGIISATDSPRDLDLDGMSDVWEIVHFGDTSSAHASDDPDGDGQSNLFESAFGTDPKQSNAYLIPTIKLVDTDVSISWRTIADFNYRLEFSSDLIQWADIEEVSFHSPDGSLLEYIDRNPFAKRFYRLRPANVIDDDGDGLNKWEESLLGTSDAEIDSDGDNMADVYEFDKIGLDAAGENDFDPALSAVLEADLVVRYGFDEQDTQDDKAIVDTSGNQFNATVLGAAGWAIDAERNAVFRFSKDNNTLIELPPVADLNDLQDGDYTLSLWFKPESTPPREDVTETAYALLMKRGRHNGLMYDVENRFRVEYWLRLSDEQPTTLFTFPSGYQSLGSWHHVAMTVDRPRGKLRLYVNGFLQGEQDFPNESPTIAYNGPWRIGATSADIDDSYRWQTDGFVDDVRIYSRALTSMEMLSLYILEK